MIKIEEHMANKKSKTPNIPSNSAQPASTSATKSAPAKRSTVRQRKQRRSNMWLWITATVIAVAVIALIVLNNQTQAKVAAPPATSDVPAELVSRTVKGSPDAKVVVTIFSDFECPACKSFAEGTELRLDDEYIKTGKILFEYKHFPLPQHEPSATAAANASECAADQGKFWEMHNYLFQEQGKQGEANTFTQGRLRTMAEVMGLDTGKFNDCLSRQTHAKVVRDDVNEGRQLFVNATPTIFVNGQKVANPTYDGLKAAIEAALLQQG